MVGPAMDCFANPLGAVRTLFNRAASQATSASDICRSDWGVKELFDNLVFRDGTLSRVPEINAVPLDLIPPNALVRFRGMVQDMFDIEYYAGAYKESDTWFTAKYTDTSSIQEGVHSDIQVWDRRIFYCIPVPGENAWAKDLLIDVAQPASALESSSKRQREVINEVDEMDEDTEYINGSIDAKRVRSSNQPGGSSGPEFAVPSGNTGLKPCIVKVYDAVDADIKLNEVLEFIGVLTFGPEPSGDGLMVTDISSIDAALTQEVMDVRFCPRKVPHLHCLTSRRLSVQDFIPSSINSASHLGEPFRIRQTRQALLDHLVGVLAGDSLAANYLLLHLLSRVHTRVEPMALGKLSLNFTGCGAGPENSPSPLATCLAEAIAALLPWSQIMPLSLEALNKASLVPKKDYEKNRLVSGALQMSKGTHLILDETVLNTGQLNSTGLQNVKALQNLLEWQKVEYDFEYYKMDMPADVPVLVLSSAKSRLFPADVTLPLKCTGTSTLTSAREIDLLDWRLYLGICREAEHIIEDSMQKTLEDDLVAARQGNRLLGPDTFHRWLTMARLLSISFGERCLSLECWEMVKDFERRCVERLA